VKIGEAETVGDDATNSFLFLYPIDRQRSLSSMRRRAAHRALVQPKIENEYFAQIVENARCYSQIRMKRV